MLNATWSTTLVQISLYCTENHVWLIYLVILNILILPLLLSQLFINRIYTHATVTHTFIFIHCAWKLIQKSHLRDMVQVLFSLVKNMRFLLEYKLYPNGFTSWPLI